jgi:hypothetical protein
MRTYSENLEYQGLVTAYQKAKGVLKAAQAEKKEIEAFFKTAKKEKNATKNAISISYFQFKQAKLKQRAEKWATRIAKLNLKEWINSFKKTEKEVEKMAVKTVDVKTKQPKNGTGNHTDAIEKPMPKAKSKSEKASKKVDTVIKAEKIIKVAKPKVEKIKTPKTEKNVKVVDIVVEKPMPSL